MKKNLKLKLGQHLVQRGLVKLRDVNRCLQQLKALREQGQSITLGQLLLREGLVSPERLRESLAAIGALVPYCPRCRTEREPAGSEPGKDNCCPRCRAVLVFQDASAPRRTGPEPARVSAPDPRGTDTTITSDPAKDQFINRIIGGCQILERIARGGMGVVYKAKQLNLGRTVAMKILAEELARDTVFVKRFINEARAAAELNHGNIVHINDVGKCDDIFFFTMEFVDGATLAEVLRKCEALELLQAADVAYQTCQALRHAHRKHIIHRDIKPENIMITTDGVVKLADLGLAKRVSEHESGITQPGAIMGTPFYMAPEQARDFSKVDSRSDIYSLGVTLYRAVTGRVPFQGKSAIEVMMKACEGLKTPVREVRPEVPEAFAALIERMMHVDPERRYQQVGEVLGDLGKVMHLLSVHA